MNTQATPSGRRDEPQRPEELAEAECFRLLRGVEVGRLAVRLTDGGIDIFPVNYDVDGDTVVFCTAAGSKLSSIEAEPVVAFEADHFDWYERTAWSVVVRGTASVVADDGELLELVDGNLAPWQDGPKPYFVRILPASTTGRRFTVHHRVKP